MAAKVDVISESDKVMLIKVTCFSGYQLIGDVVHLCRNGSWQEKGYSSGLPYKFPICKSKFIRKVKYVEAHFVMK